MPVHGPPVQPLETAPFSPGRYGAAQILSSRLAEGVRLWSNRLRMSRNVQSRQYPAKANSPRCMLLAVTAVSHPSEVRVLGSVGRGSLIWLEGAP